LRVDSLIDGGRTGRQQAPSWLPRLLPRGVAYQGRVHEQPISALPRRRLELRLEHDGYLPDAMARKRGRNRRLLKQALLDNPDDPYLHYQLGKDLEVHGDFAAAEPCFSQALARVERQAGWRHDLLLRQLFTLKKLGRFEAGMVLAQQEMAHWGHSPDFFFTLGDLLLEWAAARPAMAASLLPMIESSWLRALHIGENPTLQDTVSGRGSFLAAHNLAVMFEALGDAAKARLWRERSEAMRRVADFGSKTLLPA
jgi:tetratricopeptide (TPR) repeat protein